MKYKGRPSPTNQKENKSVSMDLGNNSISTEADLTWSLVQSYCYNINIKIVCAKIVKKQPLKEQFLLINNQQYAKGKRRRMKSKCLSNQDNPKFQRENVCVCQCWTTEVLKSTLFVTFRASQNIFLCYTNHLRRQNQVPKQICGYKETRAPAAYKLSLNTFLAC